MQTTSPQAIAATNTPVRVTNTTTKNTSNRKKTQNLDYVIRSGLAGGVAGCVVIFFFFFDIMN